MRKRVKLNSYEPLVRDKSMKFVTRSWYNKIFPFVKPFEFLKTNEVFQCKDTTSWEERRTQVSEFRFEDVDYTLKYLYLLLLVNL